MSKSLMVLGGSGFFGKTFLYAYLQGKLSKYKISKLILVSKKNKLSNKRNFKKKIVFLNKDLSSIRSLPFADYIIYGAEYVNPLKILENYRKKKDIKTFNNVFNRILSKNKFIKSKLVYISSGSVYKNRNLKIKRKLSEKSKTYNINFNQLSKASEIYTNNKLIGEQMIINLSKKKKIRTSIIRSFALVGQHLPLDAQYVLGNFILCILKKKSLKIFEKSSKQVFRSFIHVDDMVHWVIKIIKNSKISTPVYNMGSDEPISIWNLAKYISKKYNLNFIFPKQTNDKFDYYVPSIKKAKLELNLDLKLNFEKSLDKTLEDLNYFN